MQCRKTFDDIRHKLASDGIWDRDEIVIAANVLLRHHAPSVQPVTNAGDGLLVMALSKAGLDLDYTAHAERFHELKKGSSHCALPCLDVEIVANRRGGIEVKKGTMLLDELLLAAREIWLQHPLNRVSLARQGEPAQVDGCDVGTLSPAEYDVVQALLVAGPGGLSGKELARQSGHPDAVNVLKQLAREHAWRKVVILPGSPHGGYRLSYQPSLP